MSDIPVKGTGGSAGAAGTPPAVPAAPAAARPRGLSATLVLALGTFAVGTDAFVVAGFLPAMAGSLDVSESAAGQSVTVFAAAYAVLSPVLATACARVPRRALLVGALLVLAAANLGSALAPNYAVLMAGRVLAAAGAAAFTPSAGAVAAALAPPERRARALAVVIGGLTMATALGVPLGTLAERAVDWRTALGLVAALCAVCAAGVYAVMPPLPGGAPVPLRARLRALRRPGVLAVLPLTALGMGAGYTVYAYTVPVLEDVGVGAPAVTWMLCLYGVGAVAGNFAAGTATDRWGAVRVLAVGYALMAAGLGVIAVSAAAGVRFLPLTVAAVMAWGASSWCQTPPQQHRLISAAPQETALVVGLNASAIYTGIGLGTLLGGLLLPLGTAQAAGAGAVLALAAGAWLAGTRRYR